MGLWSAYFIAKLLLFAGGYIGFNPWLNLLFAAFTALPPQNARQRFTKNLIALPLQGACRKRGTTVFLDPTTLEPYEDQWALLSALGRVPPELDALIPEQALFDPEKLDPEEEDLLKDFARVAELKY